MGDAISGQRRNIGANKCWMPERKLGTKKILFVLVYPSNFIMSLDVFKMHNLDVHTINLPLQENSITIHWLYWHGQVMPMDYRKFNKAM